jgi:hypothetical protein
MATKFAQNSARPVSSRCWCELDRLDRRASTTRPEGPGGAGTNPAVEELLAGEARNSRDLAHFEVPKRFLILSRAFSIEGGELTPTLSVRRRSVEQHYADRIDALYASADAHGIPQEPAPAPPG